MSFLGKGRKEDLIELAEELGIDVSTMNKVIEIKGLILESENFDEDDAKVSLGRIIEERIRREAKEYEERLRREAKEEEERIRKEEREARIRKEERDFELEMKRLELRRSYSPVDEVAERSNETRSRVQLMQITPKYDEKKDEMQLYLVNFERRAEMAGVIKSEWVAYLLGLLPTEIANNIAREPPEKANNYDFIKEMLLKRYKLNPEKLRQLFFRHQKDPEESWRSYTHALNNYFNEWVNELEVQNFDQLKNLMVADQLKRRVPNEVKEHFLDKWNKMIDPLEVAEKVDEYESLRDGLKKNAFHNKAKDSFKWHQDDKNKYKPNGKFENTRNQQVTSTTKYKEKDKPFDKTKNQGYYQRDKGARGSKPTCFTCGDSSHFARACPTNNNNQGTRNKTENICSNLVTTEETLEDKEVLSARITVPALTPVKTSSVKCDKLTRIELKCGSAIFDGILDTGAQISVIRHDLIPIEDGEGQGSVKLVCAFGLAETAPLVVFNMKVNDSQHCEVPVICAVSKKLVSDMLICPTAYEALNENIQYHQSVVPHIVQENELEKKCSLNKVTVNEKEESSEVNSFIPSSEVKEGCKENRAEFIKLQQEDESLANIWEFAKARRNGYDVDDGLLVHSEWVCGERIQQVVLPTVKREFVLKTAHEIPLAGHLGEKKTKERIKYSFFWPTIKIDVRKFCGSCKPCQVRRTVTYRDRIPIQPITRPDNPFEVWSVDCIGPLEPPSRRGHKYIICAVDLCTRWVEAIPTKNIKAKTTCDVLMQIFARTGFPKVICTDQGTNFTSKLTGAFMNLIGVSPRFSTPGHPESMGAVERWNRTLKDMMNKNIQEYGNEWDVHLPHLLFAYREVPHCTTGISPYQLVYGRIPKGPTALLKEVWTGEKAVPMNASPSVERYVEELQDKLKNAHKIANENAELNQQSYAHRYNLRSREKTYQIGDKVLILIPTSSHKLLNTWSGPATVVQLSRPHSAIVELDDGSRRELHFNKIRPYVTRVQHIGLVFEQDEDFGQLHVAPTERVTTTKSDVEQHIIREMTTPLNARQRYELSSLLCKYNDVFSTKPGIAKVDGHVIKVTNDCSPKRLRPYRIPVTLQNEVDRQIRELLELGLIEQSDSEWAHPLVCVAKKNGSVRLCVDFRLLNSYTIPDAYPMRHANELLYQIGNAQVITVLDLTKGYWQIPMSEKDRHYTAFVTHTGHYQWRVMPFGMKNAGSTFQKSMDKVLAPHKDYCQSYIDDVAIFSGSWSDHLKHIDKVFQTLRQVGLTVNLEKCDFGKTEVKFLGHVVGSGRHSPDPEKVEAMKKLSAPTNKKELRTVLGIASYYRDYIPNFASIVLPLTNLTKKRVPKEIPWNQPEEEAFQNLKNHLVKMPSLYTPQFDKPFQLYTDASANAVGACLSQLDENGKEHPIAFYSKKLTPCQTRWSTIEREAYSVLAALQKFDTWIFGTDIEVVSDHNPLSYLTQGLPHGAKLARWSLALQRYNLKITYRKGSRHGNADALSRFP